MLEEKIVKIAKSSLGVTIAKKYINQVKLSGFIFQKPKFFKPQNGRESATVIVHQPTELVTGEVIDKTFNFITYIPEHVEKLKSVEVVCFVTCLATIEWFGKAKTYTIQVHDLDISMEVDMELEPPYNNRKENL